MVLVAGVLPGVVLTGGEVADVELRYLFLFPLHGHRQPPLLILPLASEDFRIGRWVPVNGVDGTTSDFFGPVYVPEDLLVGRIADV